MTVINKSSSSSSSRLTWIDADIPSNQAWLLDQPPLLLLLSLLLDPQGNDLTFSSFLHFSVIFFKTARKTIPKTITMTNTFREHLQRGIFENLRILKTFREHPHTPSLKHGFGPVKSQTPHYSQIFFIYVAARNLSFGHFCWSVLEKQWF